MPVFECYLEEEDSTPRSITYVEHFLTLMGAEYCYITGISRSKVVFWTDRPTAEPWNRCARVTLSVRPDVVCILVGGGKIERA